MSLQVSVPNGLVGLGGSSPVIASVLGWHYNRGMGSQKKHRPLGQVCLSPPSVGATCKCCLGCQGEKELCGYLPSFTRPIMWVCGIAGCLARGWMVPAPGKARAPHAAPAAPKPLPKVSQGSGLPSRLCCGPGSQGPPSSGKSRLSFTNPWGAGEVVPEEPLLVPFGGSQSERKLWGLLQLPGHNQVNSERSPKFF